jgi:hypothetical protein
MPGLSAPAPVKRVADERSEARTVIHLILPGSAGSSLPHVRRVFIDRRGIEAALEEWKT